MKTKKIYIHPSRTSLEFNKNLFFAQIDVHVLPLCRCDHARRALGFELWLRGLQKGDELLGHDLEVAGVGQREAELHRSPLNRHIGVLNKASKEKFINRNFHFTFKQSRTVARCLWTACESRATVFNRVFRAT